jgi:hypothetical protein
LALAGCSSYGGSYARMDASERALSEQCGSLDRRFMGIAQDPSISAEVYGDAYNQARSCHVAYEEMLELDAQQANRRAAALRAVGQAMDSAADSLGQARQAWGRAAADVGANPPPEPPMASPAPELDLGYLPKPAPHGCIGQVPVSGPGLNPCPSP